MLGWLILHDDVASADGEIRELVDLGGQLTDAALAAAASFAAYLIGSLSGDAFGTALNNAVQSTAAREGLKRLSLIHGI